MLKAAGLCCLPASVVGLLLVGASACSGTRRAWMSPAPGFPWWRGSGCGCPGGRRGLGQVQAPFRGNSGAGQDRRGSSLQGQSLPYAGELVCQVLDGQRGGPLGLTRGWKSSTRCLWSPGTMSRRNGYRVISSVTASLPDAGRSAAPTFVTVVLVPVRPPVTSVPSLADLILAYSASGQRCSRCCGVHGHALGSVSSPPVLLGEGCSVWWARPPCVAAPPVGCLWVSSPGR